MCAQFGHSPEVFAAVTACGVLLLVCHHIQLSFKFLLTDCASQMGLHVTLQSLLSCQHLIACWTNTWLAVLNCYVKHQFLLRHTFQFAALARQVHDLDVALQALFIAECLFTHWTLSGVLWICLWMLLIHVSFQP